ncbi:hypothetical protein C8R44DRAFT_753603 [Mycena epipterygia]|nr:hypothetical protein C8R44DRAFT_753603 [Mycena epipterygia]
MSTQPSVHGRRARPLGHSRLLRGDESFAVERMFNTHLLNYFSQPLTWNGYPKTVCRDDYEEEHIGTYSQSTAVRLNKGGMNVELGAVEYIPVAPTSFRYTRHTFTGTAHSDITYYGAILGDNMPPWIRICLPGCLPWPERLVPSESENIEKSLTGPPFVFWDTDFNWEDGSTQPDLALHAVSISGPDLPASPIHGRAWGWQGDWATALLERQDRHELLGERTEIVWNTKENPTWGVQAIELTERLDDEDENSRGISDYDVRATVLRVFVKSEGIARLRDPAGEA